MSKLSRIRGSVLLFAVLIGWASVPVSLAFGFSGVCRMACCTLRGKGGHASCHNHENPGSSSDRSDILQAVSPLCNSNCALSVSSIRFFPTGINREKIRLIDLSKSAISLPPELGLIHNPLNFAPTPTRAPPARFA